MSQLEINAPNRWRLETPGHAGWSRTARPDDPNLNVILETITRGDRELVMVQRYIPEIAKGDKRILVVNGVANVASSLLLVDETQAGRATTMSLNGAVLSLSSATGGFVGGLLPRSAGPRSAGPGRSSAW